MEIIMQIHLKPLKESYIKTRYAFTKKWWFLLQSNARPDTVYVMTEVLANMSETTVEHPYKSSPFG
jgi:hypothetical protein